MSGTLEQTYGGKKRAFLYIFHGTILFLYQWISEHHLWAFLKYSSSNEQGHACRFCLYLHYLILLHPHTIIYLSFDKKIEQEYGKKRVECFLVFIPPCLLVLELFLDRPLCHLFQVRQWWRNFSSLYLGLCKNGYRDFPNRVLRNQCGSYLIPNSTLNRKSKDINENTFDEC